MVAIKSVGTGRDLSTSRPVHIAFAQYQQRNLLAKNIHAMDIKNLVHNLPALRPDKKEKVFEEFKILSQADNVNLN